LNHCAFSALLLRESDATEQLVRASGIYSTHIRIYLAQTSHNSHRGPRILPLETHQVLVASPFVWQSGVVSFLESKQSLSANFLELL
jgi:hypothetical protein